MPVVAVIAAVALDGIAVSAAVAGTLTTLSAITAIGATLGAIGQVTHNKTLSMIGAGIGLVGGIGTLAFGSDALGNVSDLFGSSSGTGGAAGAAGAVGDTIATDSAAEAAYQPGAITADALPGVGADGAAVSATGNVVASTPTGLINSALAPAEGNAAGIVSGGNTGSVAGGAINSVPVAAAPGAAATGTLPDGTALTDGSWADMINAAHNSNFGPGGAGGIMNWAKNNQMLAYGVLQAGGSFISGLTNPMTPAQIAALDSQANANNAAAALANRQVANLASGMPTAVTGKPAAVGGGIINNNSVKAAPVTGTINATAQPGAVTGAAA